MKKYLSAHEAIIDLHERGFCYDFQLTGNDLLWLQEKIFVRAGDFSILEQHRFYNTGNKQGVLVVFGILAFCHDAKGILINHYKGNSVRPSPVITKKLNEMQLHSVESLVLRG